MKRVLQTLGAASAIILMLVWSFTRTPGEAFGITIAAVMLWLVPGYTLVHFTVKDLKEYEKVVIGIFMGYGLTAWLLYYPNFFGLPTVRPILGYLIGIACLAALLLIESRKK
jgi:uncharacterized membrane protein